MALTSTLFTGLSGLDVNTAQLNTVGNNIANANTTAFKTSRTLFAPQFYVTDSQGTPPSADSGGTNPSQHGLGASVASTEQDFTPGAIQSTGHNTDMAIDGQGFFVVKSAAGQQFTRDGSFTLDSSHQLVTRTGAFVQGFGADAQGNIISGQLQKLTIPLGTSTISQASTAVTMQGNLDAGGKVAAGASILGSQSITSVGGAAPPDDTTLLTDVAAASDNATPLFADGDVLTLSGQKGGRTLGAQTFDVTASSTVGDLMTFYQDGFGIDTSGAANANPNIPAPGTELVPDATDPNSVQMVITGNEGDDNALTMTASSFVNQNGLQPLTFAQAKNGAGVASNPSGESVHTAFVGYDSLGNSVNVDVTAVLESTSTTGNVWRFFATSADNKTGGPVVGDGTLTFGPDGKLSASTGTDVNVDRTGTGATSPLSIQLDFGAMTQLSGQTSSLVMTRQDGMPPGTLNGFAIGTDGIITGAYTNGLTKSLGQVALASFANPQGLNDVGGNTYSTGANSGVPVISAPEQLGTGTIRAGALELSNVDLSKEFTNLIIASTGFSASSRVISTSNQLIQDLLNSAR